MSRFPMQRYPNGWFQVAYARELEPGGVMPLRYFGRDLVLFRTEDGEPALLDAFCPHLGAHLGHGGRVKGKCVECPFHAWRFDTKGACAEIPYAQKIPPKATLGAWPLVERNGLLMTWFHSEGLPPQWELPEIAECYSDEWTPFETADWKIRTHNQEMAENSVDTAHFRYLHGTADYPEGYAEPQGHVLHTHSDTLMTTPQGKVKGEIDVHAYGFGFTTTRFKGIVETLLVASATTIDEDYVHLRFSFTVKKMVNENVTSTVAGAFQREIKRQLEQDIPVWENKIFIHPPLLVAEDGPIGVFRKWAKQFYSDGGGAAAVTA